MKKCGEKARTQKYKKHKQVQAVKRAVQLSMREIIAKKPYLW